LKHAVFLLALIAGTIGLKADPVNVAIYAGFQDSGDGAPFSDPVGSFTSPDIQFGTDTGFQWFPYGLPYFGAVLTGVLDAADSEVYRIALVSDDGSELFIDGVPVIDDGGLHGAGLQFTDLLLDQGMHNFEVDFFQGACCSSGLDLDLPDGLTYADTPDPATSWFVLAGLIMLVIAALRKSRT
jgi:hypothetical protein